MPKRVEHKTVVTDALDLSEIKALVRSKAGAPAHADVRIWFNAYEGGRNFVDCDGDLKFEVSWTDVEGGVE